ncbi:MAG: hypothetical protein ACOY0T_03565 [Myxococcota bacterium]
MRKRFLGFATLLFAACSGNDRAGALHAMGGNTSGGALNQPRGGNTASGGTANGDAGSMGDAGQAGDGGNGSEPSPPLCAPEQAWGDAQRINVSTEGTDVLAGISADELVLAWLADGELYYAERSSPDAAFGTPVRIPGNQNYFAAATLSADGLFIIGVRNDGKTFGVVRRSARDEAFGTAINEAPFAAIASAPSSSRATGPFADPVLSANGLSLMFSALDPGSDGFASIYVAKRLGSNDRWPFGDAVLGEMLHAKAGQFRRPSGLSADARTLFYWDETSGDGRAAFRSFVNLPFELSVSLGARSRATPNAACDRLYYSADGTQGVDLFVEKRQ